VNRAFTLARATEQESVARGCRRRPGTVRAVMSPHRMKHHRGRDPTDRNDHRDNNGNNNVAITPSACFELLTISSSEIYSEQ
jgi:hypothetical protein